MPKLPRLTAGEIVKILEKNSFILIRQKGSHRIFKSPKGKMVVIPFHNNEILHPKIIKGVQKILDKNKI